MKISQTNYNHKQSFKGKLYIQLGETVGNKLTIHNLERIDFCRIGDRQFAKIINALYEIGQIEAHKKTIHGRKNVVFEFRNARENLKLVRDTAKKSNKFITPYQARILENVALEKIISIKYAISDNELMDINKASDDTITFLNRIINYFVISKLKKNIKNDLTLKCDQDWLSGYFSPYKKK